MAEREDAVRVFESRGPEETRALGRALGRGLPPGAVVAVDGDLGAGKTVLVHGIAEGLGAAGPVGSPTYQLMKEHRGGRLVLYHYDAWMEGRERAFLEGGGDDALFGGGVAAVEWADRVAAWLPLPRLAVRLRHLAAEEREVRVACLPGEAPGDLGRALAALVAALGGAAAGRS